MIGPGEVMVALIVIGLPVLTLMLIANRFFRLRDAYWAAFSAAIPASTSSFFSRSHELEERVRVLEQIVTDGGAQTAAQIEALRDPPRRRASRQALPTADKAS
jgi:hypothetical protein